MTMDAVGHEPRTGADDDDRSSGCAIPIFGKFGSTLAAVALLSACSLRATPAPDPVNPRLDPPCTDSMTRPVLDLIAAPLAVAGGLALGVAVGGAQCGDFAPCQIPNPTVTAAGAIVGAVTAAVGISGVIRVRGCRRAKRAHRDWIAAGRPADLDRSQQRIDEAARDACAAWRRELAAASTGSAKLALVRRRPDGC